MTNVCLGATSGVSSPMCNKVVWIKWVPEPDNEKPGWRNLLNSRICSIVLDVVLDVYATLPRRVKAVGIINKYSMQSTYFILFFNVLLYTVHYLSTHISG